MPWVSGFAQEIRSPSSAATRVTAHKVRISNYVPMAYLWTRDNGAHNRENTGRAGCTPAAPVGMLALGRGEPRGRPQSNYVPRITLRNAN